MIQSYTYSPNNVTLIISGFRVTGWESIEVKRQSPTFKVVRGIRGKNTRVRDKNGLTEVRVIVDQTSPANKVFHDISLADYNTGNGLLTLTLRDPNGYDFLHSNEVFLEGQAVATFSAETTGREWVFHCLSVANTSGGDPLASKLGSIFSKLF